MPERIEQWSRRSSPVGQGTLSRLYRLERQGLLVGLGRHREPAPRPALPSQAEHRPAAACCPRRPRARIPWRRMARAIDLVLRATYFTFPLPSPPSNIHFFFSGLLSAERRTRPWAARTIASGRDRLPYRAADGEASPPACQPDALRAARLKFGGVAQVREATRDELRGAWLRDFGRDLRVACRALARVPSFSLTAILTIGLGIGAAAAMFTVVDGVLLRSRCRTRSPTASCSCSRSATRAGAAPTCRSPLPRLAGADARLRGDGRDHRLPADRHRRRRTAVGAGGDRCRGSSTSRHARRREAAGSPAGELQRGGARSRSSGPRLWERWLGDAAFRRIDRHRRRAARRRRRDAPGFDYPQQAAIWTPREQASSRRVRTAHNFRVVARVKPGIEISAASAELSRVSRALKVRYGTETLMSDAVAVPILDVLTAGVRPALRPALGGLAAAPLVACTNVSNLLVARAIAGAASSVQLAIGASAGRITRQWLAETLTVAGLRRGGRRRRCAAVRARVRRPGTAQRAAARPGVVRWASVAFAGGVAVAAALVLSLLTAWGTRSAVSPTPCRDNSRTGSSSRRQMRAREVLIVAQVALTMVLFAGAGLLARSFVARDGGRSRLPSRRRSRARDLDRAGRRGRSGLAARPMQEALLARSAPCPA